MNKLNSFISGLPVGHLASAAAYTIFGLNIIFCKDITRSIDISPLSLFTLRSFGAASLFWLASLFMPREKVDRKDLPKIALASFLGFVLVQVSFLYAIPVSTTTDTAVMSTLSPVFTMLFAAVFIKEPVTFKKAAGVTLSLLGVLMLIFNSFHAANGVEKTSIAGFLLLFVNMASFAAYLGIFRPLIAKYSVIAFMKWIFLFALLLALPFSARELLTYDFTAVPGNVLLEIGYLVFFATFVAYFLIPVGQKHIRPTLVSMYSYLQPIIATIIGIAVGMDTITWQKAVAAVLIFSGVGVVIRSRSAAKAKP